jgi:hypothetical protein
MPYSMVMSERPFASRPAFHRTALFVVVMAALGEVSGGVAAGSHGTVHSAARLFFYIAAVVSPLAVLAIVVWYRRATGRWPPPPWDRTGQGFREQWRQSWRHLRGELRFGHKRWHKVALAILVLLSGLLALLIWGAAHAATAGV